MNWGDVGIGLVSGVVGGAIVGLINSWLATHRETLAEKRDRRRQIQEASTAVAELLSEWVRPKYMREDGQATNEDRWKIQREYWKTLMWLDEKLIGLVVKRLANLPDALETGEVVIEARKVLLNLDETELKHVNYWPPVNANVPETAADVEAER